MPNDDRITPLPTSTHIPTGDDDLDAALGGGWPLGAVSELGGTPAAALLARARVFANADVDAAIAQADEAITAGRLVAVRVPPAQAARAAKLLGLRARERRGAVLLLTADPTDDLLAAQEAQEARMLADAEALLAGLPAPSLAGLVAARVEVRGGGAVVLERAPVQAQHEPPKASGGFSGLMGNVMRWLVA